MSKAAN
jgi:hypothetical protein